MSGIVYQNIVFALAIKFACLVLGALGLASMWTAIFADVGVMVLACLLYTSTEHPEQVGQLIQHLVIRHHHRFRVFLPRRGHLLQSDHVRSPSA